MKKKLAVLLILTTLFSLTVVAAAYPESGGGGDTPSGSEPAGPQPCNCEFGASGYTFTVEDGGRAFQDVKVVVNGQVYDMYYDNGYWNTSLCDLSKGNYYYIITTRFGIQFETSVQTL